MSQTHRWEACWFSAHRAVVRLAGQVLANGVPGYSLDVALVALQCGDLLAVQGIPDDDAVVQAASGQVGVVLGPGQVCDIVAVASQRDIMLPVLHIWPVIAAKARVACSSAQLVQADELVIGARGQQPAAPGKPGHVHWPIVICQCGQQAWALLVLLLLCLQAYIHAHMESNTKQT